MNTRLQQFLSAENLTQSQFADSIGVARASISHILAGRNKPGFEFVENLAKRYPALNIEWFITGKGRMYKSSADVPEQPAAELFEPDPMPVIESDSLDKHVQYVNNERKVAKILLFYTDGTFEEFTNQ